MAGGDSGAGFAADGGAVLDRLTEMAGELIIDAPLEERVARVLSQTVDFLGCDRSSVMMWDGLRYRAAFNAGNPPHVDEEFHAYSVPAGAPLVAQAHDSGVPVVVNAAKQHPVLSTIAEHSGIESIVIAAMYGPGGTRQGFLTTEFNENEGSFGVLEAKITGGVAILLSVAISSAHDLRDREAAERDRRLMLAQLADAERYERRRIGIDIHDDVLQRVVSLGHHLETISHKIDETVLAVEVARLGEEARDAGRRLRNLVNDLSPLGVDTRSLRSALLSLVESARVRQGVTASLAVDGERRLTEPQSAAVYRIVQQALDNVSAHAQATSIEVLLVVDDESLSVEVKDNGRGFDPAAVTSGRLGLFSMAQRAEQLDGICEVVSGAGVGTTVRAEIPLNVEQTSRI